MLEMKSGVYVYDDDGGADEKYRLLLKLPPLSVMAISNDCSDSTLAVAVAVADSPGA